IPHHADMLDDLRAFQTVKGTPRIPDKRTQGNNGTQRHGDAGIAKLLLYYAYRTDDGFEIDFKAGKQRATADLFEYSGSRFTSRGFGTIRGHNNFRGY
ncbi:TPA: hypothetical protein QB234_002151, partial [Pasteurella multocida]|nr:hypothetical protein [Pasteurella multocida]HDR1505795.1 hypothetical protein [Pasteurella multocida]HDR1586384.1 hypothetical protein [Pasteurella multocida]